MGSHFHSLPKNISLCSPDWVEIGHGSRAEIREHPLPSFCLCDQLLDPLLWQTWALRLAQAQLPKTPTFSFCHLSVLEEIVYYLLTAIDLEVKQWPRSHPWVLPFPHTPHAAHHESSQLYLQNIFWICLLLSVFTATTFAQATIISHPDPYCRHSLMGIRASLHDSYGPRSL